MQTENRNEQVKQDLRITGSSSFGGGEYGKISISGSGHGTGDVICDKLSVSGSAHLKGALSTEECHVSGSAKLDGNLVAQRSLHISGSQSVSGSAEVGEMKISGSIKVEKDLSAQQLTSSGSMHVHGDCHAVNARISGGLRVGKGMECETLYVSGSFTVEELLNVGKLEVHLGGDSRCGEIGGDEVIVDSNPNPVGFLVAIARKLGVHTVRMLHVGAIEANRISLQYTKAEIVRGQNIVIGSGCDIDRVEYSETLQIADDAVVRERIHL